jgi:hypothetical protein
MIVGKILAKTYYRLERDDFISPFVFRELNSIKDHFVDIDKKDPGEHYPVHTKVLLDFAHSNDFRDIPLDMRNSLVSTAWKRKNDGIQYFKTEHLAGNGGTDFTVQGSECT